jgi:TPR repeat protein
MVDEPSRERSEHENQHEPLPNHYPTYAQEVGFRDDAFLLDSARPSFAYSYRMFIGTALAIVIVVLGYMSWRSGQAASQLSQPAPQAQPASTVQPTPPASASPNAGASVRQENPDANSALKDAAAAPGPDSARVSKDAETSRLPIHSARPAPRPATLVEKTTESSSRGSGSEELAIAQRYLNPGDGEKRDNSAAAEWLWKAVAKRNGEATMLLSDLYLRGTGIQKNCDQARVLLRAAAQNGRKDAAERLRQMPAFGCE